MWAEFVVPIEEEKSLAPEASGSERDEDLSGELVLECEEESFDDRDASLLADCTEPVVGAGAAPVEYG